MNPLTLRDNDDQINIGSNADDIIIGSGNIITLGENSVLVARGDNLRVWASRSGDTVSAGGDGQGASNGDDIAVTFLRGGTLFEFANSRVDVQDDDVTAYLRAQDTLGIYGAGEIVDANHVGDAVWVGQNGQSASGAAIDFVKLHAGGDAYLLAGSNVIVNGSDVDETLVANDSIKAVGRGIHVDATASDDVVEIGGNGRDATDADDNFVTFTNGGAVNLLALSRADVAGGGVTAALAAYDTLGLYGDGDLVDAAGPGDAVWIGQTTAGGALDTVDFQAGGSLVALDDTIVAVNGDGVTASIGTNDRLTIGGTDVTVNVASIAGDDVIGGFAAGDRLNLGSVFADDSAVLLATTQGSAGAVIHLDNAGDTLTLANVGVAAFASYVAAGAVTFAQ